MLHRYFIIILFSFFCSFFIHAQSSQDAKLFVVWALDTTSVEAGKSLKKENAKIRTFFQGISDSLSISFQSTTLIGDSFTKDHILQAIKSIQPAKNDALIVIFGTHCLCLNKDSCYHIDKDESMILKNDIFNLVKEKKAGLKIILHDCCSRDLTLDKVGFKSGANLSLAKLKKLFLQSSGLLQIHSSKDEEWAHVGSDGSFGISCFLYHINEVAKNENIDVDQTTWELILEGSKKCVQDKADELYQEQTLNWEGSIKYN